MRTKTLLCPLKFNTAWLLFVLPCCLNAADISPANGPTVGGTAITITADFPENFGTSQGSGSVTLGGVMCTIQSWGSLSIVFLSPAGVGINKTVIVTTNGGTQIQSDNDFDYNAPTITAFSPNSSPTTGGGTCTITGTNFGPIGTIAVVTFNGNAATSVTVLSHTSLSCVVPAGAGLSVDVDVTIGSQTNTTNPAFNYNAPTITSVNPNTSNTQGGGTSTITGTNFGPVGTTATVVIAMGTPVTATITVAHTTMTFTVPAGIGTNLTIRATVAGQNSNNLFFSYNPPSIISVSPSPGSTVGNYTAVITGINFGPAGTSVNVFLDGMSISASVISHTTITFIVPSGSGNHIPLVAQVNGGIPDTSEFNYAPPQISGMIPNTGEPVGGYTATITGINFGPVSEPMMVFINGVPVTALVKNGHTGASFIVPAGTGVNLPVTATVDNQQSTINEILFSYVTPGQNASDVRVSGDAVIAGDLRLGNLNSPPVAGTIRWTGSDFIGWTGSEWVSFTNDEAIYDYDGNEYSSVVINSVEWLNENLRVTTFNDGTPIPLITSPTDWNGLITPGMGWFNNDQAPHEFPYGALYNWYTVSSITNGGKNVCPVGWHVPNIGEWNTLIAAMGGSTSAGSALKEAGTIHWDPPNTATNSSGFTAVGAGQRTEAGAYTELKLKNYLWSSTAVNATTATVYSMSNSSSMVPSSNINKKIGASVRCVKD